MSFKSLSSLIIPSALFLLSITSAAPTITPGLTPDVSPFPSPESPPEFFGVFDLNVFTLQLPMGNPGKPDSIPPSKLSGCNGWKSKDHFYVEDGALVMKVPRKTDCVTTKNSKHCRTELRESEPRSWDPKHSTNSLSVQLAVTKPDDSQYGTVIGQIKVDDDISKKPVAELYYAQDGTIRLGVSKAPDVSSLKWSQVGHVAVGTTFEYELKYSYGDLSLRIGSGEEQVFGTGRVGDPRCYFKVGNYNQGEGASEVRFYRIDVQHG
jgi:hypothetical protein